MSLRPLPKYIHVRALTNFLNAHLPAGEREWSHERVQNIIKSMGIAICRGRGSPVLVKPEDLAGAWPDMYETLIEKIEELPPYRMRKVRRKLPNKQTGVRTECVHEWSVVGGTPMTQTQCIKCGTLK